MREEEVKSSSAYLLFYRRRRMDGEEEEEFNIVPAEPAPPITVQPSASSTSNGWYSPQPLSNSPIIPTSYGAFDEPRRDFDTPMDRPGTANGDVFDSDADSIIAQADGVDDQQPMDIESNDEAPPPMPDFQ